MRLGGDMIILPRPRTHAGGPSVPGTRVHQSVLIVDDQRTFADLLQIAISHEDDLDCVGIAYDLTTALAFVEDHHPDLVVMDLQFDGDTRDGLDATAEICARFPDVRVMLLTGHADDGLMQRAADAGACALMPKNGSLGDLLMALRTAPRNGLVVHPTLMKALARRRTVEQTVPPALSRREQDVLAMLMIGLDARSIAGQLGISLNTTRGYVKTLLRKLDAHSQLEAVAIARRRGLARVEDVH